MKKQPASKERFQAILRECAAHEKRLSQAKGRCAGFFPLTPHSYDSLSDDQVEHVDQMVYRFTKLQDALGAKLFPAILSVLREDAASLTVFDMLSELEKAGAVTDAAEWASMRETRNELAHDNQDDPEDGSRYLNDLYAAVEKLQTAAEHATAFVEERVIPGLP